jgi:hypothetical protein
MLLRSCHIAALGSVREENADPERTQMTFEMMRLGWPNTAAILALAAMPLVALTTIADQRSDIVQTRQTEPVAICLSVAECPITLASRAPETVAE